MLYMIEVPAEYERALYAATDARLQSLNLPSNAQGYAKVGGGMVFITDVDDHETLLHELRKHHLRDATVTPLVPLQALAQSHLRHRASGAHPQHTP